MFWENFLTSKNAQDTTDTQLESLIPLAGYRLILVNGADALKFLQGQCTCDLSSLSTYKIVNGAHCTPKGRMLSNFVAAQLDEDTIALRVHYSIAESALAALKKYAVFSKVSLTISADHVVIGVISSNNPITESGLTEILKAAPEVGQYSITNQILTLHHDANLYEIWCPSEKASNYLSPLKAVPLQKTSNLWNLKNIQRGVGEVQGSLIEKLLPQEMNLQYTDGISFKKGCYTGQEIVARIHYRGQMKKHMYRGRVMSSKSLVIGEPIYLNEKPKGSIINVALCGNSLSDIKNNNADSKEYEFLALCDDTMINDDTNKGSCKTNPESAAKIQWQSLPYAIS